MGLLALAVVRLEGPLHDLNVSGGKISKVQILQTLARESKTLAKMGTATFFAILSRIRQDSPGEKHYCPKIREAKA
jgi:hypothetical protein